MTARPRLYPGHQHQWAEQKTSSGGEFPIPMVVCTVCGFQAPRTVVEAFSSSRWENDAHCAARWQRLGDGHLHRCEFMGRHAPPHRCSICGEESYRPTGDQPS